MTALPLEAPSALADVLREDVMPLLRTYPSFNAWVPQCGTGPEIYEVATVIHEQGLSSRSRIYGTDASEIRLTMAKRAAYPDDSRVAFFAHDLGTDASFNEFHLIVCGDFLGGMPDGLWTRAWKVLDASLSRFGFLVLATGGTLMAPDQQAYVRIRAGVYRKLG